VKPTHKKKQPPSKISPDATDVPETAETYVGTWDDLAAALGVEERTLFNFRQRHAREIVERRKLLERADGRHCVPEWRKFADEFDELNGRGANNPDLDHVNERDLRLRERLLAVQLGEHKLAVQKGDVLALTEYQAALRVTIGAFDAALKQFPGRAADKLLQRTRDAVVAMLRAELTEKQFAKLAPVLEVAPIDHAAIIEILETELEAARRALAEADFLQPDPALA